MDWKSMPFMYCYAEDLHVFCDNKKCMNWNVYNAIKRFVIMKC